MTFLVSMAVKLVKKWLNRNTALNSEQLKVFFFVFPNLKTIVLGMVSMVQTSIAKEARKKCIRVIGFDDGLALGLWSSTKDQPTWSPRHVLASWILGRVVGYIKVD